MVWCDTSGFDGRRCYSSAWDDWIRWVVLVVVVLGFTLLFIIFSCITARRRRRAGRQPFYGTGWASRPPPYQTQNPHYQEAAPPYSAQAPQSGYYGPYGQTPHGQTPYGAPQSPYQQQAQPGYFQQGPQQGGIELQQGQYGGHGSPPPVPQHPTQTYQPPRAEDEYAPPPGPPPAKA